MSGDAVRARLSWNEFRAAIEQITQIPCNAIDANPWLLEKVSPIDAIGNCWMVKRNDIKRISIENVQNNVDLEPDNDAADDEDEVSEDDPAAIVSVCDQPEHTLVYEWHVCYRAAFQAPALYFRIAELDGTPVTTDVVLPPDCSVPRSAITQAPHPVLETPFWHIHPCETAQAMAVPVLQLERGNAGASHCDAQLQSNYVAIWLTMYAVPLGVKTPFNRCICGSG
jgi:hypothetical protein